MKRERIKIYFDGRCGWCMATTRRLQRLDWAGQFELIDFYSIPEDERPVAHDVFDRGIPVRTRSGAILIGFDGLRHALLHTPIGVLVAWTLYIPGLSHLGRYGYRLIARRRPRLTPCETRPEIDG